MVLEPSSLSSSGSSCSPLTSLPVELFRDIVETLAWSEKGSVPQLMLVSKQVYIWLRPILYHSITLGWSSKARPQDIRFFRTHLDPSPGSQPRSRSLIPSTRSAHLLEDVRHLSLYPLYELQQHTLFAPFPFITKLAFWLPDCRCCDSRTMNALLSLPFLREICFGHPKSFGTFVAYLYDHPETRCETLTHVAAFNTPWSPWRVSQFPALTHLILGLEVVVRDINCVSAIKELLGRRSVEFELLVLLVRTKIDVEESREMLEKCGLTDHRVAVVPRCWESKKAGHSDVFWEWLAETWAEGRRAKERRSNGVLSAE